MELDNNVSQIDDKAYLDDPRLKELRPAHRMVMICFLNGMNQVQTAKYLSVGVGMVSKLWNKTDFRTLFEELDRKRQGLAISKTAIVKKRIMEESINAQEILIQLMNNEQTAPSIRSSIAMDILNRAGHKPKDEVEIKQAVTMRVADIGYDPSKDPFMQYTKDYQKDGEEEFLASEEEDLARLEEELENEEEE
jgi:hypothetical protein